MSCLPLALPLLHAFEEHWRSQWHTGSMVRHFGISELAGSVLIASRFYAWPISNFRNARPWALSTFAGMAESHFLFVSSHSTMPRDVRSTLVLFSRQVFGGRETTVGPRIESNIDDIERMSSTWIGHLRCHFGWRRHRYICTEDTSWIPPSLVDQE